MVVSKYGFLDMTEYSNQSAAEVRFDPSRMAQGIVTGVGFLGAGLIYLQKGAIRGLTTAAGVWAVSGIGMSIGSGMHFVGISATVILLLAQIILHNKHVLASKYKTKMFKIYNVREQGFQKTVQAQLESMGISIIDVYVLQDEENDMSFAFLIEAPRNISEEELICLFRYRSSVEYV